MKDSRSYQGAVRLVDLDLLGFCHQMKECKSEQLYVTCVTCINLKMSTRNGNHTYIPVLAVQAEVPLIQAQD